MAGKIDAPAKCELRSAIRFLQAEDNAPLRRDALNLLQRESPNASVRMAAVQQKARLARLSFRECKSIVTVQRIIRLEYRNYGLQ
ncbi:hypothetical protein AVEN_98057-1, partial [Araneus ventricosus]